MQENFDPLGFGGYRAFAQPPPTAAASAQPKKKQKDFWTDQISTVGGILGGIAGVPLGVFGAAGGSALGSGLGEALENALMGEDATQNVAKEALLGGIFGGGPLRLGGAIASKVAPRAGKAVEEAGKNLLGTQANLTRAQARQLGSTPQDVLGDINARTGLTNINKMTDVGENVTGKSGVLSELTRNAIGNTTGVDIKNLYKTADDLFTNKAPLASNATRKNVLNQVKNSVDKMFGTTGKKIQNFANPYDAFDTARGFEASAARIRSAFNASPADLQVADVYQSLADDIKGRLFSAPGVSEGLQMARGGASDAFTQLAKGAPSGGERRAYEQLAKEAGGFTDIQQVRSAQAPFVGLGKINRATAEAQAGAGAQIGDNLQGLGKVVQRPTNILALPLNAATPAVGGALTRTGRALQGSGSPVTRGGVAQRVGGAGLISGGINQTMQQPVESASLEDTLLQTGGFEEPVEQMAEVEQSPYSRENLIADIQRDPKNAEKYIAYFQGLEEIYKQPEQPKLSSTQQATAVRAQNALNDISTLQKAIQSGDIQKTIVPGSGTAVGGSLLGTTDIESALFNIGDVILRSRTGAQAPEAEIRKFVSGFLPRAGESRESQLSKLQRAYRELVGMANPPAALGVGNANSLEDVLLQQN